jgi:hypothetical protein
MVVFPEPVPPQIPMTNRFATIEPREFCQQKNCRRADWSKN